MIALPSDLLLPTFFLSYQMALPSTQTAKQKLMRSWFFFLTKLSCPVQTQVLSVLSKHNSNPSSFHLHCHLFGLSNMNYCNSHITGFSAVSSLFLQSVSSSQDFKNDHLKIYFVTSVLKILLIREKYRQLFKSYMIPVI